MSVHTILVTLQPNLKDIIHDYMVETFAKVGYEVKAIYSEDPVDEDTICREIANCSGYIVGLEKVTHRIFDSAPLLKCVTKFGVGTDNIDISAAEERGVEIANCPGSNSNAVAEATLGLLLNISRNVQNLCNELRNKTFKVYVGTELAKKTVGILGFGNIGRKVAEYLQPFQTNTLVYDVFQDQASADWLGVRYASLEEIFTQADYVSVHLPLTEETNHIVDTRLLNIAKDGLFLVNIARGGVVDENDLYQAVQEGKVARAAVDVFEFEPPTASRMLDDDRFLVTPHIGAGTLEASFNMTNMSIDNIVSVIEGKGNPFPVRLKK